MVLDELYLGLVLSSVAVGDITSVDWSTALSCEGVVDKVDYNDVPGQNRVGVFCDELDLFAEKKVGDKQEP